MTLLENQPFLPETDRGQGGRGMGGGIMTTQAQAAGELYSRARDAVMEGGVRIGMIVNHIITMVNGWSKYPAGHLWRDREVPPEGKVVHLDRFEDYLLKPPREGLGLPSLLTLDNILKAHRRTDEAEQALAILRREVPGYDARVARERAKLEVEKVRPSKTHEEAGRLGGRGKKAIDNINGFTEKTKGGTSKSYLLSRLKRDHPEIAARVLNGEFKSIQAAALEAGIVRPMRSVPVDTPEAAVRALLRVFQPDELVAAVLAMTEGRARP